MATKLETERLLLREFTWEDLDFLASLLADPQVMHFWPKPSYDRDEAKAWMQRTLDRYARDGYGHWLAIEKSTGRPVGQVGPLLQEEEGLRFTEVGYIFATAAWGKGYATEAAAAVVHWCFETLGLDRMHALIRPENTPSQQVARRLGMRPGRQVMHGGFVHDLWYVDREAEEQR
ncbi:GNAT family N-acetyltransferase [Vulgatibacter sp.]|uniref:GNAT family N-acetyltransferase n=1 Tax=Vulgatibacter sp. TaxID=1971226 RepID=UPI00356256DB